MKKTISLRNTFLSATLLFVYAVTSYADPISFVGKLDLVEFDNGGGIYSGTALGTSFSGVIDDVSANGHITNGSTLTSFGCCIAAGALDVTNNMMLDSDTAAGLNTIIGSNTFSAGQIVDTVDLEGDQALAGGGRIEIGLNFFFPADTFDNEGPLSAPLESFEPIVALFFILEEGAGESEVYSGIGQLLPTPPALTTGTDSTGSTNASLSLGVSINAGASYTDDVMVGNTVAINAVIEPDSSHVGENLNVVVAVEVVPSGDIMLLTPAGLFPFTNTFLSHSTITNATASNTVSILDGFVATTAEVGNYLVYIGYLVEAGDGFIYYTTEPAPLNVQ